MLLDYSEPGILHHQTHRPLSFVLRYPAWICSSGGPKAAVGVIRRGVIDYMYVTSPDLRI